MNKLMENFLGALEVETELYRSLLSVVLREKEALLNSQLEDLNEASKEKENLLLKIRILEEQRMHMSDKLADFFGCPSQDLTLKRLSQLVEEPYSKRLEACRSELLTLIKDMQETNLANKTMIAHSLDLIKGSISLLDGLMASNKIYYPTGRLQNNNYGGKVFAGKI